MSPAPVKSRPSPARCAERDVAGAVRLKGERHAAKARGHGVEVRRLGVEGDEALLRRGGDPVFERLQVRDLGIAGVVERDGSQPILHPAQLRRRPGSERGFLRMRLATGRRWLRGIRARRRFAGRRRLDAEGLRNPLGQRVEFHRPQERQSTCGSGSSTAVRSSARSTGTFRSSSTSRRDSRV